MEHKTLFIGEILENWKMEKRFLINKIAEHMGREIEETKQLFEYKRDPKASFSGFIANRRNLVTIVETVQGMRVAGFYSGQYVSSSPMNEEALLFSLTNLQCYTLNNPRNNPQMKKENKAVRGMVYDRYYLIYGNAELRVKEGEKKLYSNFGVSSAYFNSRGDKVELFLG
jgi:hypothetical protein